MKKIFLLVFLLAVSITAKAGESDSEGPIYLAKMHEPFFDALSHMELFIQEAGYKVLRIQRVDVGLQQSGYSSEPYRIIFFGRKDVEDLINGHPSLSVYLPLTITLYGDGNETHVVAMSPLNFTKGSDAQVIQIATAWDKDMKQMFHKLH